MNLKVLYLKKVKLKVQKVILKPIQVEKKAKNYIKGVLLLEKNG